MTIADSLTAASASAQTRREDVPGITGLIRLIPVHDDEVMVWGYAEGNQLPALVGLRPFAAIRGFRAISTSRHGADIGERAVLVVFDPPGDQERMGGISKDLPDCWF